MRKKLFTAAAVGAAALCGALWSSAHAQLIKLPAVPFTVADCNPGQHWGTSPSHGGLARCLTNNPPAAPTCPGGTVQTSAPVWNGESWSQPVCAATPPPAPPSPPPGPTCLYSPPNYMIIVGDYGNCTADGGCDGTALQVKWGGNGFQNAYFDFWSGLHTTFDMPQIEQLVQNSLANSGGFSRGALIMSGGGNGNSSPSYWYQVCH